MYEVARGFGGGQEFATSINVRSDDSVTGVTELGVQPAPGASETNMASLYRRGSLGAHRIPKPPVAYTSNHPLFVLPDTKMTKPEFVIYQR